MNPTVTAAYTAPNGNRVVALKWQGATYTVRQTPKLTTTVWMGSERVTKAAHPHAFHTLVGAAFAEWERPAPTGPAPEVVQAAVARFQEELTANADAIGRILSEPLPGEAGPTPEQAPALAPTVEDDRHALAAGLSFVGMHGGVRTFQVSRGRSSGQRLGRVSRVTETLGGGEWVRWAAYREDGSRVGYADSRLAAGQLLLAEADAAEVAPGPVSIAESINPHEWSVRRDGELLGTVRRERGRVEQWEAVDTSGIKRITGAVSRSDAAARLVAGIDRRAADAAEREAADAAEGQRWAPHRQLPSGKYGVRLDTARTYVGPEPVLHVVQLIRPATVDSPAQWGATPGRWAAGTLAGHTGTQLAIDYGQGWALDEVDTLALVAYARELSGDASVR
jgi:hypothetical protein